MTTMEYEELIELGFNKNEAKVYLSLVRFGKADANQLIKDTKFHKNIVYDNLEKLIDKGLVTFVVEQGRRVFKIAPAHMLVEIFDEKRKTIDEKRKKAEKIAKEIENISKKIKYKQEATVYRGVKGIRSFYEEVLRIRKKYIVFGAPQESLDVMGNVFWANYNKKLADSKIRCRLIFNEGIRAHGEKTKTKFIQVKYFDKDFEPFTETNIQGDRVAIIVWTEEPILFLIQDKHVAESYKEFFEKMWKEAIS